MTRSAFFRFFAATSILSCACLTLGPEALAQVEKGNDSLSAVIAVVHVDVEPKDVPVAIPLLTLYARTARHDPAVLHIQILQQLEGNNHFTLVESFRSRADYQTFVGEPYVKHMRDAIQPMLGSPFDERLHSALTAR